MEAIQVDTTDIMQSYQFQIAQQAAQIATLSGQLSAAMKRLELAEDGEVATEDVEGEDDPTE